MVPIGSRHEDKEHCELEITRRLRFSKLYQAEEEKDHASASARLLLSSDKSKPREELKWIEYELGPEGAPLSITSRKVRKEPM